jgi:hypothetical protein
LNAGEWFRRFLLVMLLLPFKTARAVDRKSKAITYPPVQFSGATSDDFEIFENPVGVIHMKAVDDFHFDANLPELSGADCDGGLGGAGLASIQPIGYNVGAWLQFNDGAGGGLFQAADQLCRSLDRDGVVCTW